MDILMRNKCFVRAVFVRSLQNKETSSCAFHCQYYPRGPAISLKMSEIEPRKLHVIDYSNVEFE